MGGAPELKIIWVHIAQQCSQYSHRFLQYISQINFLFDASDNGLEVVIKQLELWRKSNLKAIFSLLWCTYCPLNMVYKLSAILVHCTVVFPSEQASSFPPDLYAKFAFWGFGRNPEH